MESMEDQVRRMILHNQQLAIENEYDEFAARRPIGSLPPTSTSEESRLHPKGANNSSGLRQQKSVHVAGYTAQEQGSLSYQGSRELLSVRPVPLTSSEHLFGRPPEPYPPANGNKLSASGLCFNGSRYDQMNSLEPAKSQFSRTNYSFSSAPRGHYSYLQERYLEQIAQAEIPPLVMTSAEYAEKEAFRANLQDIVRRVCLQDVDRLPLVNLECFGSFRSGFATAGSDLDLVLVSRSDQTSRQILSLDERDLPRRFEQELLQLGHGARLLTRTRVPILKICQKPGKDLLQNLRDERAKWDNLPSDQKHPNVDHSEAASAKDVPFTSDPGDDNSSRGLNVQPAISAQHPLETLSDFGTHEHGLKATMESQSCFKGSDGKDVDLTAKNAVGKSWTRHRSAGLLDFPRRGVGIQCDINFFNPLGLHNTQLLRCYSRCDPRVQPMVIFVKAWAQRRKINSSYSGTLSSYGFVLMVLHYLINVAQPPVLPNLQDSWRPGPEYTPHSANALEIDGWIVDFWRDENQIEDAFRRGMMSQNQQSISSLLIGLFQYYASPGGPSSFRWMSDCLSLRTRGGLLSKESKGWVKAVTETENGKRVQNRYLFCIEDPFELSHNVARTVTHNGIVAIRDEFRRARRIFHAIGAGHEHPHDGELFASLTEEEERAGTKLDSPHSRTSASRPANGAISRNGWSRDRVETRSGHNTAKSRSNTISLTPSNAIDLNDARSFPPLEKLR